MKRSIFLLGAMIAATPALAQQTPATGEAQAGGAPTMGSVTPQTQTAPQPATPTSPVDPAQTAAPAQPADPTVAAQPAPAATGDQVAAVVDQEFATYDKNSDGALSRAEFGDWMVTLKAKSDPSTTADAPATKTWVAGAFKQADADKSKSVSKPELTAFLGSGSKSQG